MITVKQLLKNLLTSRDYLKMAKSNASAIEHQNTKVKRINTDEMTVKEPFSLFKAWFEEACATPNIPEPRAMCLSTCTRSGVPSGRFVILRGYSSNGFWFFTNYNSRKGKELDENPIAALTFYWHALHKSIRIEGTVDKLSEKDSTEFFHSRPKSSQLEAIFSNQSQPICSRSALKEKEKRAVEQYAECTAIPKPAEWGGYNLKPEAIEFWQGQNDHIHDRIRFKVRRQTDVVDNVLLYEGENGWLYERLQP